MRARLPITRRDFLDGVALAVAAAAADRLLPQFMAPAFAAGRAPQDEPGYYPPALTGLRGNHVGSFEAAHRLRDREFWSQAGKITGTGEARICWIPPLSDSSMRHPKGEATPINLTSPGRKTL